MTLAASQAALAAAIRQESPLAASPSDVSLAERLASGNDRLSPVEQLEIYREQFWFRHLDALRDDFASIDYLLTSEGAGDAFERLARAYLTERPSTSFTLRDLGMRLPAFVASQSPWSGDPLLADLARVEWAFVDAFDGPDARPFDQTSIVGVEEDAWPRARIVLHPSLQRLSLAYPAHDYRIAARKHEHPARPAPRACHVAVYRGRDLLHCRELGADAAAMLDELEQGTLLGEACERAAAASGAELAAFQSRLGGWFSEWTSLGFICAVTWR